MSPLSMKVALETIAVIGEVDVAYTHNTDDNNYVYDVWFKVTRAWHERDMSVT